MIRAELLSAMRWRLGTDDQALSEPPRWSPPAELFVDDPGELQRRFLARLDELGAEAGAVASRRDAQRAVERLIVQRRWAHVSCPPDQLWSAIEVFHSEDLASAPFGLCEAEWGLAETGTVVEVAGGRHRRATSLLPPAVGFFVPRSRIVSRLTDVLGHLGRQAAPLPPSVVFISGPSRSADIGSVVCRGVHGPGEVHVWVIEEE